MYKPLLIWSFLQIYIDFLYSQYCIKLQNNIMNPKIYTLFFL